jgi:hypothetical protein
MALTNDQMEVLRKSIDGYSFPCECYDFLNDCPSSQQDMMAVESMIRLDLKICC